MSYSSQHEPTDASVGASSTTTGTSSGSGSGSSTTSVLLPSFTTSSDDDGAGLKAPGTVNMLMDNVMQVFECERIDVRLIKSTAVAAAMGEDVGKTSDADVLARTQSMLPIGSYQQCSLAVSNDRFSVVHAPAGAGSSVERDIDDPYGMSQVLKITHRKRRVDIRVQEATGILSIKATLRKTREAEKAFKAISAHAHAATAIDDDMNNPLTIPSAKNWLGVYCIVCLIVVAMAGIIPGLLLEQKYMHIAMWTVGGMFVFVGFPFLFYCFCMYLDIKRACGEITKITCSCCHVRRTKRPWCTVCRSKYSMRDWAGLYLIVGTIVVLTGVWVLGVQLQDIPRSIVGLIGIGSVVLLVWLPVCMWKSRGCCKVMFADTEADLNEEVDPAVKERIAKIEASRQRRLEKERHSHHHRFLWAHDFVGAWCVGGTPFIMTACIVPGVVLEVRYTVVGLYTLGALFALVWLPVVFWVYRHTLQVACLIVFSRDDEEELRMAGVSMSESEVEAMHRTGRRLADRKRHFSERDWVGAFLLWGTVITLVAGIIPGLVLDQSYFYTGLWTLGGVICLIWVPVSCMKIRQSRLRARNPWY